MTPRFGAAGHINCTCCWSNMIVGSPKPRERDRNAGPNSPMYPTCGAVLQTYVLQENIADQGLGARSGKLQGGEARGRWLGRMVHMKTDLEASISQAIVNLESSNDRIIEKAVAEMRLSNEWAISKTNLNFLWLQ
eukprot:gene19737-26429_t